MTTENNAAAGGLTDEQRTLIGHAAECLKQGGWAPLALKLHTLLAAAPKVAEQAPVDAARGEPVAWRVVHDSLCGRGLAVRRPFVLKRGDMEIYAPDGRMKRWKSEMEAQRVCNRLNVAFDAPTQQPARASEAGEAVAWVRYRSDGGFEGPIMDSDERMCDVRRKSGAWTPLYHGSAQQAVTLTDDVLHRCAEWCDSQARSDWYGRTAADMVRAFAALQSHSEGEAS